MAAVEEIAVTFSAQGWGKGVAASSAPNPLPEARATAIDKYQTADFLEILCAKCELIADNIRYLSNLLAGLA
jgi:hypothetical protein